MKLFQKMAQLAGGRGRGGSGRLCVVEREWGKPCFPVWTMACRRNRLCSKRKFFLPAESHATVEPPEICTCFADRQRKARCAPGEKG